MSGEDDIDIDLDTAEPAPWPAERPPVALGIDLGSVNVRAAIADLAGARPLLLGGKGAMPAVTGLAGERRVVGAEAEALLRAGALALPPPDEESLARLLMVVRAHAEEEAGPPGPVAFAVPPSMGPMERAVLVRAAERAGLRVVALGSGPALAAWGWARGRGLARRRLLACDLGASGLRAAAMVVTGDDLEVEGVRSLPGRGLSAGLDALCAARGALESAPRARLRSVVAHALEDLESAEAVEIRVPGEPHELAWWLARNEARAALREEAEAAVELCRGLLRSLGVSALDAVLLHGGLARPFTRALFAERLGLTPREDLADSAAALGAALLARAEEDLDAPRFSEIVEAPLFALAGGGPVAIHPAGARLPAVRTLDLIAAREGTLPLFAGKPSEGSYAATVRMDVPVGARVQVEVRVTPSGLLACACRSAEGNPVPCEVVVEGPQEVLRQISDPACVPAAREPAQRPSGSPIS